MTTDDPMAARLGWSLTAERVAKKLDELDLPGLLDRIESDMEDAVPEVQWTMNTTLAEVGIHFTKHRKCAIKIRETLDVYRDYPHLQGLHVPVCADLDQRFSACC